MPSWTRQIEHEMAERAKWDEQSDKERKEHGFNVQVDNTHIRSYNDRSKTSLTGEP